MVITCPDCGSANGPQNRFCSTCGFNLAPKTEVVCPQCNSRNPATNLFCDECGARLAPVRPSTETKRGESSVRGLSLPSKTPAADDQTPDWLAQLRSSYSPGGEEESQPPTEPGPVEPPVDEPTVSSDEDQQLPAWLQESASEPIALPDQPTLVGAPSPSLDVPDWLEALLEKEPAALTTQDDRPSPSSPVRTDVWETHDLPAREPEFSLDDVLDSEPAAIGDLPDWLQDLMRRTGGVPGQPQVKVPPEPKSPSDAATGVHEEVPECLQEPTAGRKPTTDRTTAGLAGRWREAMDQTARRPAMVPPSRDELPDWLRAASSEFSDSASADTPLEEEPGEFDDLPDWLRAFADETLVSGAAPVPKPPAEPLGGSVPTDRPSRPTQDIEEESFDRMPDWLEELGLDIESTGIAPPEPLSRETQPAPKPPHAGTGPLPSQMMTQWLGTFASPAAAQKSSSERPRRKTGELPGTGPLVPSELPDWLAAVSTPYDTDQLPDWLEGKMAEPSAILAEGRRVAARQPAESLELPAWLSEIQAELPAESEPVAPTKPTPPGVTAPVVPTSDLSAGPVDEAAVAELPDWLVAPRDISEPAFPETLGEPPADTLGLERADIPAWLLALKPRETVAAYPHDEAAAVEFVETGGPLHGLRGAIPVSGVITKTPKSTGLPKFVVTELQQAREQMLDRIVRSSAATEPEPGVLAPRRSGWIERSLIPVVLFLVVLLSALPAVQQWLPFSQPRSSSTPILQDTFDLLNALPDSALALVAFDYSPAAAGELDPIARTLVRHLMERNARIVAVSTVPTGPALAERLLQDLAETQYRAGDNYLNLGYVPGGAAGLQAFASTPWKLVEGSPYSGGRSPAAGAPAATGLGNSLQGVELILVLTAERNDLVAWLEQVGQLPGMNARIVAGVSAGLESWAQPYFYRQPKQLSGLVSGVPAAALYDQQADRVRTGLARDLLTGQTPGLLLITLLLVAGILWGIAASLTGRRRAHG